MGEDTSLDRLQPCLLNRLTDEEPESQKEGRDRRIISMRRYRAGVLADLEDLLNTKAHPPGDNIYDFKEAARSVLNYGIRDLCGVTLSDLKAGEVEALVKQTLLFFEPRILSKSLSVKVVSTIQSGETRSISIEIDGELWAQPMSDHLYIKTEIDVETGHYDLKDR